MPTWELLIIACVGLLIVVALWRGATKSQRSRGSTDLKSRYGHQSGSTTGGMIGSGDYRGGGCGD
ncbi:MAG: hypothetical protein AAGC81_09870 [Pseudomonadota bacterium]